MLPQPSRPDLGAGPAGGRLRSEIVTRAEGESLSGSRGG